MKRERIKSSKYRLLSKLPLNERINQLKHVSKNGRKLKKYSEAEKVLSQNINLRSQRTYNFLKTTLNMKLPSKSSLNNWSPVKFLKPGINNVIMQNLKNIVGGMNTQERNCILTFDEIAIRKALKYNSYHGEVQGFKK